MLRETIGLPSVADDPDAQRWFAKLCRYAATPSGARSFDRMWMSVDIRSVLPAIRVPTLLALRTGGAPPEEDPEAEARYLADRIPGARLAILPGGGSPVFLGDQEQVVGTVEAFVRSVREEEAELGDRAWRELVGRHHQVVRSMLGRYRGTEVDTAGDGFFATFDGPARAARCALAIVEAVRPLGIEVRAGVHTGEVETTGEKVGGIAVHIGARVGALAASSEVLASSTVKDLVAGSGLAFEDRGEHELKGVPNRWHLYRVAG
jgi:class 3 adenylate cyclase